jgi:WD40 repeat protein
VAATAVVLLACAWAGWLVAPAPTTPAEGPPPAAPEEEALDRLLQRAKAPREKLLDLRQEVLAFRREHPALRPERVAELLKSLPSPLDKVDDSWVPKKERFAWQPKELTAVLGVRRSLPKNAALAVVISPDGRQVAGGWEDGQVKVWDLAGSGPESPTTHRGHGGRVTALAYAPDGKLLASGGQDGTVTVWDAGKATPIKKLPGQTSPVAVLAFAPDGKSVAIGSWDGAVRLWEPATGKSQEVWKAPDGARARALSFLPGGGLACGSDSGATAVVPFGPVGQAGKSAAGAQLPPGAAVLAFAPDGRSLLAGGGDGSLHLFTRSGDGWKRGAGLGKKTWSVNAAAFSTDSRTVAVVGNDGQAALWEAPTGKLVREWPLRWPIFDVAFASDSRHVVTANANGTLYLLRVAGPVAAASEKTASR